MKKFLRVFSAVAGFVGAVGPVVVDAIPKSSAVAGAVLLFLSRSERLMPAAVGLLDRLFGNGGDGSGSGTSAN